MTSQINISIKRPKLTSYQEEFLYNGKRFTFTEASTKCGKTFSHIFWIFERSHENWNKEGYEHWWVAPVYDQAKIAFNRLRRKIARYSAYTVNETRLTIVCPNGAIIRFRSADKPDNLFGDDVHSIVFDEAPRAKVDAWYALRSTITATGGFMKLIGNFGGTANWMHQLKNKAKTDENYAYYRVNAWDAVREGILDRAEVEQAQKDLPDKIFKQLYLAEETESEDQLISFDTMESMYTNDFIQDGEMYISADIALHGSDKFVTIVWRGWRILKVFMNEKMTSPELISFLEKTANRYNVQAHNIVFDADGIGGYLKGFMSKAVAFNNGGTPIVNKDNTENKINYKNLKSQCGYEIAKHANEIGIAINEDNGIERELLFQELECLQSWELDKDGKLEVMPKKVIIEKIGRSPDVLDAFVMRYYFELNKKQELFFF